MCVCAQRLRVSNQSLRHPFLISINVFNLRIGATDKGEGGVEDDVRTRRHRALAQGSPQIREELRPALPRGLLRQHHLPPRHQILPHPRRRSHRNRNW